MTLEVRSERERAKGSCSGLGLSPWSLGAVRRVSFPDKSGSLGLGTALPAPARDSPWRGIFAFASETATFWIECRL